MGLIEASYLDLGTGNCERHFPLVRMPFGTEVFEEKSCGDTPLVPVTHCDTDMESECGYLAGHGGDLRALLPDPRLENTGILARVTDVQLGLGRKWTLGLKWTTWCKVAPAMSTRGNIPRDIIFDSLNTHLTWQGPGATGHDLRSSKLFRV